MSNRETTEIVRVTEVRAQRYMRDLFHSAMDGMVAQLRQMERPDQKILVNTAAHGVISSQFSNLIRNRVSRHPFTVDTIVDGTRVWDNPQAKEKKYGQRVIIILSEEE